MSAEKQQTPSSAEDGGAKSFATTQTKTADEAPDPDEDDLDELDDVLDEFAASKAKSPAETTSTGKPAAGEPGGAADGPAGLSADDFDDQLAKEMAKLMGDVDSNPEMKKQIDEMMKELGSVMEQQMGTENAAAPTGAGAGAKSEAGASTDDSFAETIRKTMERMQASGDKATAEASAESNDDFMAEMLKQLSGNGGDEDFSKMLLGMMEQLTNKEILYEPMKELHDKFPAWMEANQEKTKAEDLARYKKQQKLVGEIVGRFEKPGYSDENGEDREYIVERMQEMQAQGSPPNDLVGDMDDAQKALGDMDSNCAQQ